MALFGVFEDLASMIIYCGQPGCRVGYASVGGEDRPARCPACGRAVDYWRGAPLIIPARVMPPGPMVKLARVVSGSDKQFLRALRITEIEQA